MPSFPDNPNALGGHTLCHFNGGYRYVTVGSKTYLASEIVSLIRDNLEPLSTPRREAIDREHLSAVGADKPKVLAPLLEI